MQLINVILFIKNDILNLIYVILYSILYVLKKILLNEFVILMQQKLILQCLFLQ